MSAPPEFLTRLSSAQLKDRLLGVLRDVFLGASELAPLILVVENMHWIDSASEEFLAHLAAGLPGHRVLLVLTTRPGYTASWLAVPLVQTITLEGLSAGDVRGMVRTLLAAARAKGKHIGRPKGALGTSKLTGREAAIQDLLSKTVSKASIAKIMGVSRSTLHHFICSRHLA